MADFLAKVLKSRVSLRFPRTPQYANIYAWSRRAAMGLGHNATTVENSSVVGTVVGKTSAFSKAYGFPQRHNGQVPPSYTCVRAPVRACGYMGHLRCGVVAYLYLYDNKEKYRKIDHNTVHNGCDFAQKSVVATVVALANPLKNNKKGGIYA